MIAGIYARKSSEQTGVADEQKSVARQVEHARHYAAKRGWTVDDAWVFVDDGISGAEFGKRPGLVRLMAALKPRPPFQAMPYCPFSGAWKCLAAATVLSKVAGGSILSRSNRSLRTARSSMVQ